MSTEPDSPQLNWTFEVGQEVRSADDTKLGNILNVSARHIMIERGLIFHHDYSIPKSAVARIEEGIVYLNVPEAALDRAGWDNTPGPTFSIFQQGENTREPS